MICFAVCVGNLCKRNKFYHSTSRLSDYLESQILTDCCDYTDFEYPKAIFLTYAEFLTYADYSVFSQHELFVEVAGECGCRVC